MRVRSWRLELMVGSFLLVGAGLVFASTVAPAKIANPEDGGRRLLSIPEANPRIPAGAWSAALNEHPRLFGPQSYLRARAAADPEAYKSFRSDASLTAVGVACALEDVPLARILPHLARARENLARGATNVHQDTWLWLDQVASAFDYFHDRIPADERERMVGWLNAHLESYTTDENAFHNSTPSKILCYLRAAYATWGENPRAREFRDYALLKLWEGKVLPTFLRFGAGGGWTECGWYSRHSLWHLVQALELARRFEGYDGFAKAPAFFYQRLAYELHQAYPGRWTYGSERYPTEGDGSHVYGGHNEYPRLLRTVLAQYFRGSGLARFVAAKWRDGSDVPSRIADFLWREEPDAPAELARFPLAHLADGIGRVYARSDWSDDATWFRFECGDFWNHHQHFEVGNFEIFRREPLATESGAYVDYLDSHSVNWLTRTIAHNCVLIFQPGETWPRMRDGGRNHYSNDGGQAHKWQWPVGDIDAWESKRETFERGDIVAYENQSEFLYVAGDCTRAYSPAKLSKWIRRIVYLRPHTFVILDQVVAAKPSFKKTWLLHCRNRPEIKENKVYVTNGAGQLSIQTLLPANPSIQTVEGYTYGGETFDPKPSALTEAANRWRIEVCPTVPAGEDIFLHVLSTDEPKRAVLIRRGSMVGAAIGNDEVLFGKDGEGEIALGGRRITLAREVKKGVYE